MSSIWLRVKAGSTMLSATQWNARSHAAYQGYSHLSGIEMMSPFSMWNHCMFRRSRVGAAQRVRVDVPAATGRRRRSRTACSTACRPGPGA